ncbi:MAG: hypothetical protein QOD03_1188, partial [Verrucomicrobiota bacterium]
MPNKHLSNEALGYEGLNFENILQECLACGLFTISEGKISLITPEAEHLLGFSQSETRSLETLPAPLRTLIAEAQAGATISNRIITFRAPSAEEISISVTAAPFGNKKNDTVVVLRNVSSVEKLEQKLQRLDRLASVGTLTASMA